MFFSFLKDALTQLTCLQNLKEESSKLLEISEKSWRFFRKSPLFATAPGFFLEKHSGEGTFHKHRWRPYLSVNADHYNMLFIGVPFFYNKYVGSKKTKNLFRMLEYNIGVAIVLI